MELTTKVFGSISLRTKTSRRAAAPGKYFHNVFSGEETCKDHTLDNLAKYGDIVNIEMAIHTGNDSFVATPAAARRTIFHISSCRAFVGGTRTAGVAEKISLNG